MTREAAMGGLGPSAARPRLVVSRCLDLDTCRYDGTVVSAPLVRRLAEHAELVAVCPEVSIGLGVPREPIRIVIDEAQPAPRLVQPATGRDLTAAMQRFGAEFVDTAGKVDGAILKSRSPSCGLGDVKAYPSATGEEPSALGNGLFAEALASRTRTIPIVDEVSFAEAAVRERFLTRAFALARLGAARAAGTPAALMRFHAEHKLLLLAHDEGALRALGPLAAGSGTHSLRAAWDAYAARFAAALARPASSAARANALLHALGHFRERVEAAERRELAESLARRHRDEVVLDECTARLREWIERLGEPYLASQALFWPFPDPLR